MAFPWVVISLFLWTCLSAQSREGWSQPQRWQADAHAGLGESTLSVVHHNTCVAELNGTVKGLINLAPLDSSNGYPRFRTHFLGWNYSFNPCKPYNEPYDDPHDSFGDNCHSVSMCKYGEEQGKKFHYTLGLHSTAAFQGFRKKDNHTVVQLVLTGHRSMRRKQTIITLVCEKWRVKPEDAVFTITHDEGRGHVLAELRHACSCLDGCSMNETQTASVPEGKDVGLMLYLIGIMGTLFLIILIIGILCYTKRTHMQFYNKMSGVPGRTSQAIINTGKFRPSADFRDYESGEEARRKLLLPVLEDAVISGGSFTMEQRLGGGAFCDTHLALWRERSVAVKRLTLLIHENQATEEILEWIKTEAWFLSRQRHKNIVQVLGVCLEGKFPAILTEYVKGDCIKDLMIKKRSSFELTWPQRVRLCAQVTDGMNYLHSTKPPIIHRDLRCGNLFITEDDVVKVADFSMTKLVQPIREQCPADDCSCMKRYSACPWVLRWTAPEILEKPSSPERSGVFTTACDVFSFGMVLLELLTYEDPFHEVASEEEVVKLIRSGVHPELPRGLELLPQYRDLMRQCCDQNPSLRPSFKQAGSLLKDSMSYARSFQKTIANKQHDVHEVRLAMI